MKTTQLFNRLVVLVAVLLWTAIAFVGSMPIRAYAAGDDIQVSGNVYQFNGDAHYEFDNSDSVAASEDYETYGKFFFTGNIVNVGTKDNVPAYEVSTGNLEFFYIYDDLRLNKGIDDWHLNEDQSRELGNISLDSDIMKGAIVVQTSRDRQNWSTYKELTNAFSETPNRTSSIYSTNRVQLDNGCFYRVVVAYEYQKRIDENHFLMFDTSAFGYKKIVEVYEFYAYTEAADGVTFDGDNAFHLGNLSRVEGSQGYSGAAEIKPDDMHYGWELGRFYVSGASGQQVNDDGTITFLKNVGDEITLWFHLNQNINALNGDSSLSIAADENGFDHQLFQKPTDFGYGALIVRHADTTGQDTIPYTNFLRANAGVDANTKIRINEEGDYEVALDYQIAKAGLFGPNQQYRIYLKFSVRNGDCMVYPMDVNTGCELSSGDGTKDGFTLDLAGSQYLELNVKHDVASGIDGQSLDTRENKPAKDGDTFTKEGIYTITVSNPTTHETTTKVVCVGKAYMTQPS